MQRPCLFEIILTVTWQSLAFLPVSSSLGLSLWSLPSPLGSFQRSIFLRVYFLQNCYHLATCNKAEAANLFCCVKLEVEKIQSWGEPPPVTCCKFRHMERPSVPAKHQRCLQCSPEGCFLCHLTAHPRLVKGASKPERWRTFREEGNPLGTRTTFYDTCVLWPAAWCGQDSNALCSTTLLNKWKRIVHHPSMLRPSSLCLKKSL